MTPRPTRNSSCCGQSRRPHRWSSPHPRHAHTYPYPLKVGKSTSGRLEIHVQGTVNASTAARDRFLTALEALGLPGLNTDEVRTGKARPGRASPSTPAAATRSAGHSWKPHCTSSKSSCGRRGIGTGPSALRTLVPTAAFGMNRRSQVDRRPGLAWREENCRSSLLPSRRRRASGDRATTAHLCTGQGARSAACTDVPRRPWRVASRATYRSQASEGSLYLSDTRVVEDPVADRHGGNHLVAAVVTLHECGRLWVFTHVDQLEWRAGES